MKVHELSPDDVAEWRACSAGLLDEYLLDEYMDRGGELARWLMGTYGKLRTEPCCNAGSAGTFTPALRGISRQPSTAATSSAWSNAHTIPRISSVRCSGQRCPTLLRNLRSTSARVIGCPANPGMLSTCRAMRRPWPSVATMRVGVALPGAGANDGSTETVVRPITARTRGSCSLSGP